MGIEEISSYTQQFSKKFRQRILIFHPLERLFIYASTLNTIFSTILISNILNYQLDGLINISDLVFYMTVPSLIIGSFFVIYFQFFVYFVIFIVSNIFPILLYYNLIQFLSGLCEPIFCLEPGVTLFRSSYLLLAFSILFEVGYIYIGYEIWRKGIWNFKNDTTPYTA
ncbi:unnamed protein product [Rhizophagus irregularis]|uniref:Uncharacterized protein n=1 Tax=Rhizophagus irregularis TaxID=588596 RepID=A0A2N1MGZ7_9GLOM|nr:hypothetical protein RhiirC2_856606 [Rhizophagus irregularis]CAB4393441.1 unnamed protein product [Rhizophagus irregularis]CAB5322604.1 unnamed protein product [Rhizophagus irregularis]